VPEFAGRYRVREGDRSDERLVTLDPAEILAAAKPGGTARGPDTAATRRRDVDASPELARIAAGLLGLEVALRALRYFRRRRATTTRAAAA
jgi:hypothetical protein